MQDNNTARKRVYDVLRDKTGYSDSYEDFNKFMDENEEARKKVYDVLKDKTGYSDSYEDFNQFMQPVGTSVQIQQADNTPQAPKSDYSQTGNGYDPVSRTYSGGVGTQAEADSIFDARQKEFKEKNAAPHSYGTNVPGLREQVRMASEKERSPQFYDFVNDTESIQPASPYSVWEQQNKKIEGKLLRQQKETPAGKPEVSDLTQEVRSGYGNEYIAGESGAALYEHMNEVREREKWQEKQQREEQMRDAEKSRMEQMRMEEESRLDKEYTPRAISSMNDVYNNYRDRFALTERGKQLSEEMAGIQKEIQDKYANRFLASDEYRKLSQQYKGNELNQKANEAFQKAYGEVISKELEPYQDIYNKEITSRYGTDMKRDLAGFAKKSVGSHLSTLTNEVNKDLDDIEEKITKQKKILRNDSGNAMVNARMNTREDPTLAQYRGERTYLEGAKDLIDESNNIIEEAGKKGKTNFFSGLARGFADTAFDPKQWTLGISDMIGGIRLKNVVEKADKGEKLSPSEEKLLDAAVTNMAVNAYYSSDLGRGYKAGQTTGASIPFMLEFAINPISAAGEGIAKSILKYGMKKFGASAMKKGMSKMGARLAGDALAAAGMEGTTGLARVTAGAQDRMMGNILFDVDKDGNLTYGGREGGMDMGKAIGKSIASTFLENQSEMIFNAFKGLGKGIWKNVEKTVPGGASEFMKYITNSRAGKLYREIKDNPTFKEAAKKAQFHGLPEEYMEEVYNNLANVPLGEMTLEEATDLDNNIDTFLGLAPTSVAFGLLGLGSMGAERVRHRQKMNAAFGNMTKEQQEKLSELERMSKERGNDDIRIFIKETMNDGSLSKEEKKAEIEYAFDIAKNNAMEDIAGEQTREESEKRTAAQEEGTDIYTTHDPVAMRTTVLREEVSRERLSSVLDDEAIDALAGANDAQRAEMLDVMDEETRRLATDYLRQKDRHDAVEDALDEAHASEYEQAAVKVQQMSPQGQVVTIPLGRFGDKEHSYGVVINGIDATGQPGETGTLMVVPLENGPEGPIFASFDENNAKTVRINADTEISMVGRDQVLEQMLGAYNADAAIMEAQPISAGQTFSIADDNGTVTGISVVGQDTMGNWSVLMEGSREPVSVSDEQLRAMKDNVDKAGIRTEYAQEDENRRQEELIRKFSPEVLALQPEKGDKIYTGGKEIVLDEEVPGGWSGKIIDNNGNETGSVLVTEEQYFKYKQSLFDAQRKDDAEAAPEIGASYITPEGESMTIIGFDEEIGGMFVVPTDEYNEVKSDEVSMNILENEAYQLGAVPVQEYTDWVKKSKSSTNETAPEGKEMGNQPLQESTESPTYEKSELDKLISSFPKKKDGSIDYESLTPQQSFQYTNLTESLETALDDLRKDIEASDAQIAKLNESLSSATRGKRNEIRDAIREAKAENEEIKNFYNSVIPITETNNNQTNGISESSKTGTNGNDTNEPVPVSETSEQGKERGTEKRPEAKGTGEERMGPEGIPDTGRKNSIQKPAAKISESITDTELPENPLVQEILSRTEPETLEELASLVLGKSLFLQMTGERSVRNMTGLSHKDLTPFLSIFRKKEKGGMTVEEAGDRLISIAHESYPAIVAKEGLENDNTGMAGTNAILSVLQQSRTFGDISNMIRNNRTTEAQRAIDAEKEYEDELKEQFYQEQYHMSPAEYEAWVNDEAFSESNVYSNEEKSEFYNTFADKIIKQQEYDNRRENPTDEGIGTRKSDEQGGIFGIRERGDAVLQGEKPVHAVGTEGYQGKSGQMEGQTDEGLHPQNDNVQDNTSTNKLLDHIAEAREMVDTSPTEAQKEAGNYKKGHIKLDGYDITIENPKGSVRSGKDANGQEWSITMNNDYGYIRGTKAVDGDHIDIFLSDNPSEGNVFVVDQLNEKGEFDESKVMYGFPSMDEARSSYLANYSPGWENRISTITEVTKDEFYKWIDSSVKKTKPFSEYKSVNPVQLAPSIESANADRMKDIETRLAEIEDRKIELEDILVEAGNDSVERDAVFSEQQELNQEQQELEAEYSGLRAMNDESNEILTSEGSDIRFREVGNEEISSFANKHNLDEADVKKYAQSMKMKNLGGASYAFKSISRNVRLQNSNLSLGQLFGDVDALRDEYVQEEMKARNMMEAARKRAEEEAESEKKRLKEFELMTDKEMDEAYLKAMEENNEARMRDIINESARRNGYVSADEFRMAHRAPSYDEEGIDKNMVDIAANKDQIRESLNEQLRMNRDQYRNESVAAINEALSAIDKGEKPTVTIYRAVPKSLKEGKVRNGDWVSLSESYVKVHGEHALNGNYRIMKEEVPAENLYWDGNDINEWGYDDRSDYRYKNTKNNRKLNDLITRDDKGNIIPPSKRFNARKADVRYRFIGEKGASQLDKAEEATTRLDNLNVAREMESAFNTKKERIEKLRKSEPIEITGKEIEPSDDLKQYKKNALEYGKSLRGEYINKDTGAIISVTGGNSRGGIREILQHDYKDVEHLQSIAAVPQIIENSVFIEELANEDLEKYPGVKSFSYYVCGLKIAGVDYTVKAVIANQNNGERYYDHKLTNIEKGKLLSIAPTIQKAGIDGNSPLSDVKDKRLLSILQTNEKENARKIKQATGWERGADGKWRYEVEDFEIDPKGLARKNRLWSNLSWGKEYDALSDKLFDGVELTEEEAARFDELSEKAEELRATYEANDVRYLDDYVKDENLFKAYPELKQIRVEIYNAPTSNTGATYYESQNLIRVNESVLDRADFRSILAHEVQHTVQSIEGFARGGNSMTYRKHLDALKEKRDAWSMIEEFADKREELGEDASQMDVYNALVNEYHSDGFEFGDGFIPSRNAFDKGFNLWVRGYDKEGYEDAYNEYQSLIEKFGLGGENDRYNELSGEVEARNVQSRMNMTPEERRNTLASETEDVAREDQIFINDALEAYASVSAPMNTAVNELSESLHTPIEKITSEDQLPQGEARRRIESGANIKGWYSPKENKVYLYMPNTTSVEDAQATIFHEVVAHKGLRELFGKDFDTFLDNVYNNAAPSIRQTINRMAENENISIRTATEEYMADLSERGPATFAEQSLWTRIKTFFIDMLRKAKVNLGFELTDNELRYILYESHNRLKQSNYPVDVAKETVMRSKLGIGEFSGSSRTIPSVPQGETLFRITGKEEKKEIIKNLKEEIRELKKQLDQARKGNKEEYETASRAMLSFIDQRLTKEAGEEMGPHMIKSLIAQVNKAASTNKLKEPLNLVEKLINYAQYDSSVKRMQKMIKTKLSGQDTRGVSKGIVVDEATRRVFDSIRSAYKDLLLTSADSELRAVRSEIVKLGKLIKSETSPESITILTGQQNEMKSRRDNLLKERAELLKTKELESVEEIRKRREELENAMDEAAEGTGVFTQTMADEYDSLSIRELLAESRKMKRDLDKLEGDLVTTRRVAYNNKGEARKFYLQEAEKIAAQIPVAQEELIRMTDNVYNELKALVDTGKSRLAMLNKEKAAHRGRIVSMGINAVKDKRIKGINEKETNMEKTVSILQSIGDFIAYPMYSFDYLLKAIDRNHAIGKGPLYDYFMKSSHGVVEANDRIYLGVKAYNKELEEKIKELFGKSMENVFRDSQKSEKRIHKQYMYDSNYHKEGDLYEANLNKGQAFYVWLTWRQPDGKMKLEADGWTEDSMTEIEFFIGDKYMKLGEWITDDFFPRLREERYNPVHVRMTGTSMASRENYFPMVIAKSEIREKGELGETIIGMPSTITGNIINRTINTLKVDTSRNAFDLMLKYGRDMETWAATAELRQDLNFLRGSKAFKNYMEANHKGMFDIFMRAAEVAVRSFNDKQKQDSLNNGLNKILRYWAGSNIAFRLNTAMKQVLSYPAFSAYSGKPGYQADLFKYIFTPAGNMKWAKEHLPSFEERVDTGNMGIEALKDENAFKNKLEKLTNAGMYPNKLIDALTCAAGARAVYNFEYERAQKRGLGNEEAANLAKYNAEIAFNESQQSSSPEMMSPMQASGNVFYKALTTYQSSNIGYQRMGIEGLLEMARAKRIYNLNIESGMNKDEAQRTMMGSYLTGLRKATFGLFVMGGLWAAGGYGIAGITAPLISNIYAMFGYGDGDEDLWFTDEQLKSIFLSAALSSLGGTSIGQFVNAISQGNKYDPLSFITEMSNLISEAVKDGFNLNVQRELAAKLGKFAGLNVETLENIYLGAESAIREGRPDLVDFMFLINLPKSQRKEMAEKLYKDMGPYEYLNKMYEAGKLFNDYRKKLPYSDGTSKRKDSEIKKKYIINNLNEKEKETLKNEKEFLKLKRKHDEAEDKKEWLEEHPEYPDMEKKYKKQTITKKVKKEVEKVYRQ